MSNEEKTLTTIQVSVETREALKTLGSKGDSYDTIIQKLLNYKKEQQNNEPKES